MIRAIYVTDNTKQAIKFIFSLASNLRKLGIKDIKHDREHNLIIVRNVEIRGISIYKSYITHGMNIKYFIDGIDMRKYKNATTEEIDRLNYHIKEVMLHFREDARQFSGRDELIEFLMENAK